GRTPLALRRRRPASPGPRDGGAALPVARHAPHLAAHPAAHDRHAPPPVRRGHHRHRHVAWPRGLRHDPPVHRGRPRDEGGRPPPRRGPVAKAPPTPRSRPAPRVPRRPVTMRSLLPLDRPRQRAPPTQPRIVPTSA